MMVPRKIKTAIKAYLRSLNISVERYSSLERLRSDAAAGSNTELLLNLPREQVPLVMQYFKKSRSQFKQDLFVLSELNFKTNGYFVEFGATNGIDLSNTCLLEKEFGWSGILAEPASCWHDALKANRSAQIETACVWKDSHSTLLFNEVSTAELSTIDLFSKLDMHEEKRSKGITYAVKTISLNDLLEKHNAPKLIDYLSIDTEGSEYEILSSFDFSKHKFRVITCEHNFTASREKIFELLSRNGYVRTFPEFSCADDFYVSAD